MKFEQHGYDLASLFGVSEKLLITAENASVNLDYDPNGYNGGAFLVSSGLAPVKIQIPLKGQIVSAAHSGEVGPASKAAIAAQMTKAIQECVLKTEAAKNGNVLAPALLKQFNSEVLTPGQKAALTKKMKKLTFSGAGAKQEFNSDSSPVSGKSPFVPYDTPVSNLPPLLTKSKLIGGLPMVQHVALIHASVMHQLVHGTSAGSKYRLLARCTGLNIAGKVSGDTLSLRVEGVGLAALKKELESVGFTVKADYASAHLQTPEMLMQKTFGAVIGAIGFSRIIEVGNPDVLRQA